MAGVWTPSTSAIDGHSAFSSMVLRAPVFSMSCHGNHENLAAEKRFSSLCLTSFSTSSYFGFALTPESTSHKRTRYRAGQPICLHDSVYIGNSRLGDASTSSCSTIYGNGEREQAISIFHRSRKKTMLHAEQGPGGGEEDEGSMQTAVEESKRLLSLQKELLDQMSERKKLLTALTEDLGNSKEQSGSKEGSGTTNNLVGTQENQGSAGALRKSGRSWPPQKTAQSGVKPQGSEDPIKSVPSSIFPPRFRESPPSSDASSSAVQGVSPNIQNKPQHLDLEKEFIYPEEKQRGATLAPESELEKVDSDEVEKPPPLAGANVMNVIVVASECAPWSKTGGLGDVVGSLPKALARRGHRVMVVVPRYKDYAEAWETGVRKIYNVGGQDMEVGYFHGYIDGVDFVFIDSPIFYKWADNIYGGSREDILARMVLLCKAAIEVPWHVPCGGVCYGDGNLVFIANDWHTALLPVYLKAYYHEHGLMPYARSILVIHNIAHQGRGPMTDYRMLGLPDHLSDKFRLYDPVGGEHMNIFYAGLQTAYRIVAVSHGYAWECQTSEGGWGLDQIIRENAWKLRGVVNGIDEKDWNPQLDESLKSDGYCNYSLDTLETGKPLCKAALQKELGLSVRNDVPVIGFIGRLDHQKGVDIIAHAMPWMMNQDLQLVLLGSGRKDLEDMLRGFEGQHREKVRAWVGFSVNTAHRITAGADILLMPSRFEPCGLNQLYAMQYGTVPVVHAVGGLRDTVQQFDPYQESGLGWRFDCADPSALIHALGNALYTYRDFKESWRGIQRRGMTQDLSWDNAAKQYEEVLVAAKYQW